MHIHSATIRKPGRMEGWRSMLLALYLLAGAGTALAAAPSAAVVSINATRHYTVDANTNITLDGVPITQAQLAAIGDGFNAQVNVSGINANATGGNATSIALRNLVKGPVTSTQPLSVLNQVVTATADTVLRDIPGNDLANVVAGDQLEVSGYLDANGSIVAARVRYRGTALSDWKLAGIVSNLVGSNFSIGAQAVNFTGATPAGCVPALQNNQFVEVAMLANPAYTPTSVLSQVTAVQCEDLNLTNPPAGTTLVAVEGLISQLPDPLPDPATFTLLGATVTTTAQTQYRGGTAQDLDLGARVEVAGYFDASARTIAALEVRFVQAQVRFEAPVAPGDVVIGESVSIMGNSVAATAQTRDQDGILAGGLPAARQLQVRGYVDSAGEVYASRVRRRGGPDLTRVLLHGPVSAISGTELLVLGVTIDTSSASFVDTQNLPLTPAAFYAQLQPGMLVAAEEGMYEPATQRLRPTTVKLESAGLPPAASASPDGTAAPGIARGTISGFAVDALFSSSFD